MILSKANLQVVDITNPDKGIPILDNICCESDGSTIASNGKALLAVSPVTNGVKEGLKKILPDSNNKQMVISSESTKEIIQALKKDTMFDGLLEHCDLDSEGKFTFTDGKRKNSISSRVYPREYFDYKKTFKSVVVDDGITAVLNLKRLLSLLITINKMCPDISGELPVLLEIGKSGDIRIRSINRKTGQKCIGIMKTYKKVIFKELEEIGTPWERELLNKKKKLLKKKKR